MLTRAAALAMAIVSVHGTALRTSTPISLTIAPPAQSGTLIDVGFLSPHAYGPNELFAQNWIFEGLVSYGPDGAILPALATSWQLTTNGDSTVDLTFQLRQNVIFHDGQQWNASVCKLNFDNVFAPALAATYHSWYDLPTKAIRWSVAGPFTFVVTLSGPYYPALNEFTFIRPLRFLSPAAFVPGVGVNSCPASRGNVTARNSWVLCSGTLAPYGTGPWIFESKVTNQRTITPDIVSFTSLNTASGEVVQQITLVSNAAYWAGAPAVQRIILPANLNSSAVRAGLLSGTIDLSYGAATLSAADFVALKDGPAGTSGTLKALISQPLQTRLLLLNTAPGRATASLAVRNAINSAINRTALSNLQSNLESPADRAFSTDNAYCNVNVGVLPPLTADLTAAQTALIDDGWVFASAGDVYRSKDGMTLSVEVLHISTDASASIFAPLIATQLQSIGINATAVGQGKTAFNALGFAGAFDSLITETLGDPYDPASYAASWRVARSFEFPAQQGLNGTGPSGFTKAQFDSLITTVFTELVDSVRADLWQSILTVVNKEALFAPLTYMTTRAVMRKEVSGFVFGSQQFDLPLTQVSIVGSTGGGSAEPSLSVGAIVGIAVGSTVGVALLVGGVVVFMRK